MITHTTAYERLPSRRRQSFKRDEEPCIEVVFCAGGCLTCDLRQSHGGPHRVEIIDRDGRRILITWSVRRE